MRVLIVLGLLVFSQLAMAANDTAYSALRVFGKKEGEEVLRRIVELRGRKGAPQPDTWKIVLEDPQARGGVREFDVARGRIVGESTPVSRDLGATMDFNLLNLDSDGAFTVVNQEAQKRNVPFDRIDYTLRSERPGAAPVWIVELYEGRHGKVGTLRIAADSGEIIDQNYFTQRQVEEDREFIEPQPRPPIDDERDRVVRRDEDEEYEREPERDPGEEVSAFLKRVGRHFQKRGRQLENFFTGKDRD